MRRELGDFLRQRRHMRRLRREDVAFASNVGYDWYVRIEQGRGHASQAALRRIADVLKLDRAELEYVLALTEDTFHKSCASRDATIPSAVVRVMHAQSPRPAYIVNTRMDLLAWNDCCCEFYGVDWALIPANDRNILWLMLTDPSLRERVQDWEEQTRGLAIRCRTLWAASVHTDPTLALLIDRMTAASELFCSWWNAPLTEVVAMGPIIKAVNDVDLGVLEVEETAWQFGNKSDYILVLSAPLDTPANDTTEKIIALAARRSMRIR